MGKRKDAYRNQQNSEVISGLRYDLRECEWALQQLESTWYKHVPNKEPRSFSWLRESLEDAHKYLDEIEKRLPSNAIRVIPVDKRTTRGKGKLNLHETDREIKERLKIERL